MKNDNSFMTRQQYRQMKSQRHSYIRPDNSSENENQVNMNQQPSLKQLKIKRLSRRLNKIIAVVILLIIIVYLILIFVNF